MSESWLRLWSGMTTDPKWQTISRKSGQPRHLVIALFTHLLLIGNESTPRGDVSCLSTEDIASALDCDEQQIDAILQAMQGRVIADGRLSGWDTRQPASLENGSARPFAHVWREIRSRIFMRDDYTCQYCGERGQKLECDHVIPVSRGGVHTDDNLVTACFACNRSKRDKLVSEWMTA